MQIAAMVRPKAPYLAITTNDYQTGYPTTTRTLIAEILCVAITDREGHILNVVERAQGP